MKNTEERIAEALEAIAKSFKEMAEQSLISAEDTLKTNKAVRDHIQGNIAKTEEK